MKNEVLTAFTSALDSLSVENAYMRYSGDKYPYLTFEYIVTNVSREDGSTDGEMFCEAWTRGTYAELDDIDQKLKDYFNKLFVKVDKGIIYFDYATSTPEDDEDGELKKLQISITTKYWKGA
ncbi:MAG: hypothetical protein IIX02_04080 [Clostridia bacterium]|nr:hypothetical protein [Clostridia bacterium]